MAPKRASAAPETQKTVTYITGHNIGQRVEAPKPGQIMMASPKMATGFIRAVQPPQNIQRGIKLGKQSCWFLKLRFKICQNFATAEITTTFQILPVFQTSKLSRKLRSNVRSFLWNCDKLLRFYFKDFHLKKQNFLPVQQPQLSNTSLSMPESTDCFLKGSTITLENGECKKIEDLNQDDFVKVQFCQKLLKL